MRNIRKIIPIILGLIILCRTSLALLPVSRIISVPSSYIIMAIRISIIFILTVMILKLVIGNKSKLLKNVCSILIIVECIGIGFFSYHGILRGMVDSISVPYGSNRIIEQLRYTIMSLVNFNMEVDLRSITKKEYKEKNITRNMVKLYEKELNSFLGKNNWQVTKEYKSVNERGYKCITYDIQYNDANNEIRTITLNNFEDFFKQLSDYIDKCIADEINKELGDEIFTVYLLDTLEPIHEDKHLNGYMQSYAGSEALIKPDNLTKIKLNKYTLKDILEEKSILLILNSDKFVTTYVPSTLKYTSMSEFLDIVDRAEKALGFDYNAKFAFRKESATFSGTIQEAFLGLSGPFYQEITIINGKRYESKTYISYDLY